MRKLLAVPALALAFAFAGCGDKTSADQACKQINASAIAQGTEDDERACVANGNFVGEIEYSGGAFGNGWEPEDD